MNRLPLILRIYCILAILLLGWYGWHVSRQVRMFRLEATRLQEDITPLTTEEAKAEETYNRLEGKQRRERGGYSGEEAVLASVAVMDAKAQYEQLHAELQEMEEQHLALETTAAALQLRIVPVLAIALLHLFGFFMIRVESAREPS
ncbi:hypothetical protein KDL44_14240 [bacterium]|nr:hypothetical protein [bacterium]